MSRIAVAAALLVVGWSASTPLAYADPRRRHRRPGPKTSFGDGTYAVGTDIAPGVYQSAGPVDDGACYWKRVNGDGIVANAMTKKPQTVQIEAGDTAFTTQRVPGVAEDRRRPAGSRPDRGCSASWAHSSVGAS